MSIRMLRASSPCDPGPSDMLLSGARALDAGSRYCMNAAALEFIEASKLPPEMKPLVKG